MEVIEKFFKKTISREKIRDLLILVDDQKDQSLPIRKVEEKFEKPLELLTQELDDVPEKITTNPEEYPICGFYTLDSTIKVKVGKQTFEIESNSLTIPDRDVMMQTRDELILIFLVNNPKRGYTENLLAQFSLNGISQLLLPILSGLDWVSLSGLYRNNPAILTLLQKSLQFWDDYWLKTYGSTLPENPWKTLVQIGDEIAQTDIRKRTEREMNVLIKYNADLKFKKQLSYFVPDSIVKTRQIMIACEYDSLDILKVLKAKYELKAIFDDYTHRGIGKKCLNYFLENSSEEVRDDIIRTAYINIFTAATDKEMIIYMLNIYQIVILDNKTLTRAFDYLANRQIDPFLKMVFEGYPSKTGAFSNEARILVSNTTFRVVMGEILFAFAIPKYYRNVINVYINSPTSTIISRNPKFSEWLLRGNFRFISLDLDFPVLTRRVLGVLERNGYKKLLRYCKRVEWNRQKIFQKFSIWTILKDTEIEGEIEDSFPLTGEI